MAGDDSSIIVVIMMVCFCSVVMAGGFGYTCTGGSFDLDAFDMDKCLEWPKKSASTSNTTPTSTTNPVNYPPSSLTEELACSGYMYEDAMTTCYDVNNKEAGVRWEWIDSDEALVCKGYTTKYGVVVSSSQENHTLKYRFPDIMGRDMNSFKFKFPPDGFLVGQNIKFYITPLNDLDEKIGNTVEATLDTNTSSEVCNAHGDAVDFSKATLITADDPKDQVPVDCAGGSWSDWGPCLMNQVDITNDQICKSGIQTRSLEGYDAATGGGTCNLEESRTCRSSGCDNTTEPDQDCVLGEWDSQLASRSLNITLYHDTYTGANTCSAACDGPSGSYPGANPGGGVRVETRDIKFEQKGKGADCPTNLRREEACNTQKCPKNCVGAWHNDGTEYSEICGDAGAYTKISATYQPQRFVVSQNEIPPGTCVDRGKTRNLLTRVEKKKRKGGGTCKMNCGYDITPIQYSQLTAEQKRTCPA
jgi:hypothetical protein